MDSKSQFAVKYFEVVRNYLEDLSDQINRGSNKYQTHLVSLRELLTQGKTDEKYVNEINRVLVEKIQQVSGEHSKMNIEIGKAPEDLEQLISKLKYDLKLAIDSGAGYLPDSFNSFKVRFKTSFEEGITSIFMNRKIVSVNCQETGDTSKILEEYIENYMGLNRPSPLTVRFSEQAIISYFNFVEHRISLNIEDRESLLNDRIKESVKFYTDKISNEIEELQEIELFETQVIDPITNYFGWLSDTNSDPYIQDAMSEFKRVVRQKIINLAERANNEVFPTLLEQRINESRQKFRQIVLEIADTIKSLEDKRTTLLEELAQDGLDEYRKYALVNEPSITDYSSALNEKARLSSKSPAILLRKFVAERNTRSSIIKAQLSKEVEDSYFGIKSKIEVLEGIPADETDEVVRYFIHSVKLFIDELQTTILGDLELPFEEISALADPIENEYNRALGQVRIQEKQAEKEAKQTKINKLITGMIGYRLPTRVADEVLGYFSIGSEQDVQTLLRSYTEESFTRRVYEILDEKSLEELFYSQPEQLTVFRDIALDMTNLRVAQSREYTSILKEVAKDVISSVPKSGLVAGIVFTTGFGIYKAIRDSGKKEQEAVSAMREKLKEIIYQTGSVMIKDKFDSILNQHSRKIAQQG